MIFGCNKRKLNQEAFYLDKDPTEITHKNKYLGFDFFHLVTLSHSYKAKDCRYESLDGQRIAGVIASLKISLWAGDKDN